MQLQPCIFNLKLFENRSIKFKNGNEQDPVHSEIKTSTQKSTAIDYTFNKEYMKKQEVQNGLHTKKYCQGDQQVGSQNGNDIISQGWYELLCIFLVFMKTGTGFQPDRERNKSKV